MPHMRAHRMAITALTTLTGACSWVPVHGSMVSTAVAGSMAGRVSTVAGQAFMATVGKGMIEDSAAAHRIVEVADSIASRLRVAAVASMEAAGPTGVAGSTEEAAGS